MHSKGRDTVANIKKYTKKDGSIAYMFNAYLGVDPLTGKPKRTTRRGFKKPKDAKLALARLELEVSSKGFVKQDYSMFKDVYDLWYAQYKNTVKPSTAANAERLFRIHILPKFGHVKIDKITKLMCQKAINEWSEYFSAFNLLKTLTQKLLNYAVSQDLIETNPMQYTIMPKKQKRINEDKKQFLELDELKIFLKNAKEILCFQDYLIFRLLAFTGIRKGELYVLNWSDVNFNEETLRIEKTLSVIGNRYTISTPKTVSSLRTIGLDKITLSELKKWKKLQKQALLKYGCKTLKDSDQLIFHRDDNSLLNQEHINRLLRETLQSELSPHSFRHTHASLLFEAQATMKDVQNRLGHSDIKTTMDVYTHVTKKSEKQAIDKLAKYANF